MIQKIVAALFFSALFFFNAYASGKTETGLPEIDRYIEEKNYTLAVSKLVEYMDGNPDEFETSEVRARRIMQMRNIYNEVAISLLDLIENDPLADEEKLEIIAVLESLEKNPNQATRDFIRDVKLAAEFTYYRAKFAEIMTEGRRLIGEARWEEAARKFTEGYVFYRDDFNETADNEEIAQVDAAVAEILAATEQIRARSASLLNAAERAAAAVNAQAASPDEAVTEGGRAAFSAAFSNLENEITAFAEERNRVAHAGEFFQSLFLQTAGETDAHADSSFLPFAFRFTLGRQSAEDFEGVLGAFDASFDAALSLVEDAADSALALFWQEAGQAVSRGEIPPARAVRSEKTALISESLSSAEETSSALFTPDGFFSARNFAEESGRYLCARDSAQAMRTVAGQNETFASRKHTLDAYSAGEANPRYIREISRTASAAENPGPQENLAAFGVFAQDFDAVRGDMDAFLEEFPYPRGFTRFSDDTRTAAEILRAAATAENLAAYRKAAEAQAASATALADEKESEYSRALALLNGIPAAVSGAETAGGTETGGDGEETAGTEILRRYPAESLEILNALTGEIASDREILTERAASLSAVPGEITADGGYSAAVLAVRTAERDLAALRTNISQTAAAAENQILQFEMARQEADLRYTQAERALAAGNFESARDNLDRARERANTALAFQESETYRQSTDALLLELGNEIVRRENEMIVREVRALISRGKEAYYAGNFEQAEQTFSDARNRWNVTNVDPNPEIENWLGIISTATLMNTGRVIPVSAPLYQEMSQLLNNASQLYNEGESLIQGGNRAQGITALNSAQEQIRKLQLVYPLNQKAGELSLQIQRVIDPQAFESFFRGRVQNVRATYRQTSQTAYSELLDLIAIWPDYPGIQALLNEVEIYLGIRMPPPDVAAIRRAQELTAQARRIYESNTRAMFEVALDQLNEAISLDPNNTEAMELKDRVQSASGGGRAVVLSSENEEMYQQAVRELQNGNKITAAALVTQLMQNQAASRSAKVLDLKRRIDSLL